MKVLRVDATFLLPDDFKGSTLEALAELVRYLGDPEAGHAEQPESAVFGGARGNFYYNTTLGLRFSAETFALWELTGRNPWRRVPDPNPPPRSYDDGESMIK